MPGNQISIFLADDNLIVREGVRALLSAEPDFDVVGVAADYDELVSGAGEAAPQVLVTDIRMPPNFHREGIDAAKELRKRHPGTGVVILSQYDEPEYAISLLSEGTDGYAYLLKDRVAEGDQLARAVRAVATGGSWVDPKVADALLRPVTESGELVRDDEELLQMVAEGRPIKAIAAALKTTPTHVSDQLDKVFLKLAQGASAGAATSLRHLQILHQAIVQREEEGEVLSRLLPTGVAAKLRKEGRQFGETERLEVTVLMSDVRGYATISEHSDPTVLAGQLNEHRSAMSKAILAEDGTVMLFMGDAVMGVFGAPLPQADHADRAVKAALRMMEAQVEINQRWHERDLPDFGLGIGISTGDVAAALLGSDERLEYTVIGDTVNLASRLQDLARPAGRVVVTAATYKALHDATTSLLEDKYSAEPWGPTIIKGRGAPVDLYCIVAWASAD